MRWLLLALALLSLACMQRPSRSSVCFPEDWTLADLAQALEQVAGDGAFGSVSVLEWRIIEDDRPLYVEKALVAARLGRGWLLASLYRHPRHDAEPEWHIAVVHDAPHTGWRSYGNAPSGDELVAFEADSWWSRPEGGSFRTLDKGCCPPPWTSVN